jgi:hypothetical protein
MGQPAAMLFGEGAVVDALFNAFSGNTEGSKWQTTAMNLGLQGFQFYDTWVKAILSRVTFRNFGAAGTAVRYMDHSDHYTPQGINAVRGLRFQNVSRANVVAVQNCGAPDCAPSTVTHSARIYSVWDFEVSLVSPYCFCVEVVFRGLLHMLLMLVFQVSWDQTSTGGTLEQIAPKTQTGNCGAALGNRIAMSRICRYKFR